MSEFAKSNPNLDHLVSSATNFEAIREACKSDLARQGIITRPEPGAYGAELAPGAQPVEVSVPANSRLGTGPAMRVFYPAGNMRFEIYGEDEEQLDAIEGRIRASLLGTR
jgi:hypothetical protein